MTKVDQRIGQMAVQHGGHVHHDELLELGLTRSAIRHRIARGFLIPVHHHVYAVAHLPTNPLDRAAGALLACGPHAGLSHSAAASVWSVLDQWFLPFEVSSRIDRRPTGIRVHHRPALLDLDFTIHRNLCVTTPALTMLDVAPRLSPKRRIRVFNELRLHHRLEPEELLRLMQRFPRHPGTRLMHPIVLAAPDEPTRSYFEDDWPPFAITYRLPAYGMNQLVGGYRVDVVFLPDLLIVELDGWRTHGMPPSFESDREQDAAILAQTGIPTMRITYRQFHDSPSEQADRILTVLAARSTRAA